MVGVYSEVTQVRCTCAAPKKKGIFLIKKKGTTVIKLNKTKIQRFGI